MEQVTAAVIIENGRLLLTRRARGQKLEGFWELPGGKVEPGESLEECLSRELQEELTMTTSVGEVVAETVYQYDHGAFRMIALRATRLSGFALSVHDDHVWARAADIVRMRLAPADIQLVDQLLETGLLPTAPQTSLTLPPERVV